MIHFNSLKHQKLSPYLQNISLLLMLTLFLGMNTLTGTWHRLILWGVLLISGFSPGNYALNQPEVGNIRWIHHLINSNTKPDEAVLYAGVHYGYGLRRKYVYSFPHDKQFIVELAEKSKNARELSEKVRSNGYQHMLFSTSYFKEATQDKSRMPRISTREQVMIQEFIDQYLTLRIKSPNQKFLWYSFSDLTPLPAIKPKIEDAEKFPVVYINQAELFQQEGKLEIAENYLTTGLKARMSPNLKNVLIHRLITLLFAKGAPDKAGPLIPQLIALSPHFYKTHFQAGGFYEHLKFYPQALKSYLKSAELKPEHAASFLQAGNCAFRMNDVPKALELYAQALSVDSTMAEALVNMGVIYLQQKDFKKALERFIKVIKSNPGYVDGYVNAGVAYAKLGEIDASLANFNKALELEPNHQQVRTYLEMKGSKK